MSFGGYLRANTEVKVVIGPFVDVGDGFTPETGVTLSGADEAEIMKHNASAVTSISAATWAAIASMDGYYNLTITTSLSDTEGLLTVVVQDDSVCLPVRNTFMVLSEAAWDSMFVAKDDGYMDVNVKAISEDTTAADNLESACDNYSATRGLAGTALPAAAADAAGGLPISDDGGLDLDAKLASTNEVTAARMGALTDWINGGRLDLLLDAIKAVTDALPDSGALTSLATAANLATVDGIVDSILEDTGTTLPNTLSTIAGYIDTEVAAILEDTSTTLPATLAGRATATALATVDSNVDAIKAVTDLLPDAGALTSLATAAALATVDGIVDDILVDTGTTLPASLNTINGFLDTEIAAILEDTGTTLPATLATLATAAALATVDGNVDSILEDTGTTLPATLANLATAAALATVDTVVDAIKVVTDALPNSGALTDLATAAALATVDGIVDDLITALVHKQVIAKATGNVELFSTAGVSLGSVAAAYTEDGDYVTRKKLKI